MTNTNWDTEDGAKEKETRMFIGIRGEGNDCSFRFPSTEADPKAKRSEYKKKDGSIKVTYDRWVSELGGMMLTGMGFHTSEFEGKKFTNLNLSIASPTGKTAVLSVPLKSAYADDIMKKIPAIDITKPVFLSPFNFKNENDKNVTGITFKQDGNKIVSFFNTYDKDGKRTNEVKFGFPVPPKTAEEIKDYSDERRKLYWQMYFGEACIFLQEYIEKNIIPKFPKTLQQQPMERVDYPQDDINPDDIPF